MRVLDDEGRLFGRVNVVDALVVLVAVVLVVGGAFVVLTDLRGDGPPDDGPDPDPEPFRYATVSYEVALDNPAVTLSAGQTLDSDENALAVTDVHRSTTSNGTAHVTARIEYRSNLTDGGDRVLAGDDIRLATRDARVDADVLAVGLDEETIDASDRSLVLATDAGNRGPAVVEPGEEVHVGDAVVATVESVEDRTDGGTFVGATVTTRDTSAGPAFGGQLVRVGNRIGLVTDEAVVRGEIVALGTADAGDVA